MWWTRRRAHAGPMQMNTMTTQTYVADHQAQLLADARRSQLRSRHHSLRRLLAPSRTARTADFQPALAAAPAH